MALVASFFAGTTFVTGFRPAFRASGAAFVPGAGGFFAVAGFGAGAAGAFPSFAGPAAAGAAAGFFSGVLL
jgi:hypothetical protein